MVCGILRSILCVALGMACNVWHFVWHVVFGIRHDMWFEAFWLKAVPGILCGMWCEAFCVACGVWH